MCAAALLAGAAGSAGASLPDHDLSSYDDVFVRTHGRGDVIRLVEPFNACTAFPGGGHSSDPGAALHARMRVRLAPFSEYEITDERNTVDPAAGRILWTQGTVDTNHYAGFTIGYRYDTEELYFVVSDSGPTSTSGDERNRVYKVSADLDDGGFFTLDWSYDEASGKAGCWIDGTYSPPMSVVNGTIEPAPQLNGNWYAGALMGNPRTDGLHTLAGRGWGDEIGEREDVWPAPNGPSTGSNSNVLDQSTSVLGDVSYAAFRWAGATADLVSDPWDVELEFDDTTDGTTPTDSAGGLDSQLLMSAESSHDDIEPSWIDTGVGQDITNWFVDGIGAYAQTRQIMIYHHGLGDQEITVTELVPDGSGFQAGDFDRSLVCVIAPDSEIQYWTVETPVKEHTIVGTGPTSGVHSITLPEGEPGVYRILVKSQDDLGYAFSTDQESLYWGAYAPFGKLTDVDALGLTGSFAYVPADSSIYDLSLENIDTNPVGYAIGGTTGTDFSASWSDVPDTTYKTGSFPHAPGVFTLGLDTDWSIRERRFPLVLCNSRIAAEYYVRAGVIETDNYTIWSPDERILRDRIEKIAFSGFGTPASIIEDFSTEAAHITGNPADYWTLATYPGALDAIHTAIERQVTDTSSGMLGSIDHDLTDGVDYLLYGDEPDSDYVFDSFAPALLFWAGWDDTDANPYYGDANLERRARMSMLAYARHIQGTRIRSSETESGTYPGIMGLAGTDNFGIGMHWGRVYGLLNSDDRAAMVPSVVIQLCHILNHRPTTTRNQDAHFLPFLYEAGRLWEDLYTDDSVMDLCEEFAHEIVDIPSPWAGEDVAMQEAVGFDGSYSGIQNYMLAAGWLVSGDEFDPSDSTDDYGREWSFLNTAIDRQYDFWSHFMFPSYDGNHVGFAHDSDTRTVRGAVAEQYSGAKQIGPRTNVLAARLLFHGGSTGSEEISDLTLASDALDDLLDDLDVNAVSTHWNGARNGTKFDLMPVYAGGFEYLFDVNDDPIIDAEAVLPVEETASNVEITQISEGYYAVNTPDYYAVIATNVPGQHWYQYAIDKYGESRDIEKHDIEITSSGTIEGGGHHYSEDYEDGDEPYLGEELGGVGLSLFYDKTAATPNAMIVGRTFSPLTTHQLIGYTASNDDRRWAEQNSKSYVSVDHPISGTGAELTISYKLNTESGAGYEVERVFDFYADNIDVTVTVSYPSSGTPESLDRIVENMPIELDADMIGSSARAARLALLELEELPWSGTGTAWDVWCATDWSVNDGLLFDGKYDELVGQEIGWVQKELALPTPGNPTVFSYSIDPASPSSRRPGPGSGTPDSDAIVRFIRAAEIGDMSADLNKDGIIDQEDLRILIDR